MHACLCVLRPVCHKTQPYHISVESALTFPKFSHQLSSFKSVQPNYLQFDNLSKNSLMKKLNHAPLPSIIFPEFIYVRCPEYIINFLCFFSVSKMCLGVTAVRKGKFAEQI